MSCDGFYTGPPPWWNGFSAVAEDNELYSISSRGRPTAASIATLVNLGGLSGTGCSRESERCCPAVVWHGALNDFSTGNSACSSSRWSSWICYIPQKSFGWQRKLHQLDLVILLHVGSLFTTVKPRRARWKPDSDLLQTCENNWQHNFSAGNNWPF